MPPVSMTPEVTMSCEYLQEFFKKIETVLMGYLGACGKLIHEKNLKSKISWHRPFKVYVSSQIFSDSSMELKRSYYRNQTVFCIEIHS
jgi:hypothetical protein